MLVVLKTNSAYSYLWPIINDTTKSFSKICLLTNQTNNFEFNHNLDIRLYNQTDTYTKRLLKFLELIDDEYVLLTHDVDLIINFNHEKIKKYLEVIKSNSIGRLSLGVFTGEEKIQKETVEICKLHWNISRNFLTPFDYAPSIYNRKKLIELYSKFPNESYQALEHNQEVQNHVAENMNPYGISKNDSIELVYHRGFVYTKDFDFLHITIKGKLLKDNLYFDHKDTSNNLIEKYNLGFLEREDSPYIQKNEL